MEMNNAKAAEEQAADWLARHDTGSWTDSDKLALERWLNASTLNRVTYLRLKTTWQRADALKASRWSGGAVSGDWGLSRYGSWRLAAAVLLIVSTTFAALRVDWEGAHDTTYSTQLGKQESVTLADGSILTLNTATRVHVQLSVQERRVWVEGGEVFFDVAHDPSRPFVVMAKGQKVTVLGTRFAIRQNGEDVLLTVLQGRVQLSRTGSNAVVLTAGDTASSTPSAIRLSHRTVPQVEQALAWRQGLLALDDMPLGEVASEFNRYNQRQLEVVDTEARNVRVGGRFDPRNLEAFARLVQDGLDLDVQERPDRIIISSRRSGN